MRPIPLLAAANGVGDPAAHPRGGAPNAGARERERGELPPPTFPRGPQGPRGFVFVRPWLGHGRTAPPFTARCLGQRGASEPIRKAVLGRVGQRACTRSCPRCATKVADLPRRVELCTALRRIRRRAGFGGWRGGHSASGKRNSAMCFSVVRRLPAITPPRASTSVIAARCPAGIAPRYFASLVSCGGYGMSTGSA